MHEFRRTTKEIVNVVKVCEQTLRKRSVERVFIQWKFSEPGLLAEDLQDSDIWIMGRGRKCDLLLLLLLPPADWWNLGKRLQAS